MGATIMEGKFLLSIFALAAIAGRAVSQDYSMCYDVEDGKESCMNVTVDLSSQLIRFHMGDNDDFEDVETLEDYGAGFAASRVESQEACYVRRLVSSLEQQVAYIKGHQQNTQTVDTDDMEVMAVPLDDPEEEVGQTLANFCGDLPVYKLAKSNDDSNGYRNVDKRQVSVTFRRCVLFCFIARCFTTTLTVPTGSTVTFLWFFG